MPQCMTGATLMQKDEQKKDGPQPAQFSPEMLIKHSLNRKYLPTSKALELLNDALCQS